MYASPLAPSHHRDEHHIIKLPSDGQQREGEQRAHDAEDEDGEEVVEERLMWEF